ncbi:MAG: hypothetical protein DI566_11605 [Microbacterium sp.]|nr:MAG: hypothetical protein DI566_11605 [Microbacterium sp.]
MGTIDDYLASLDTDDAAIIAHTYDIAHDVAPEAEQGIGYGMPALVYRGTSLLSVMRAKNHFGIYPFSPAAIVEVLPLLEGVDHAKGTIRFTQPLPDETIRALVEARKAQIDG